MDKKIYLIIGISAIIAISSSCISYQFGYNNGEKTGYASKTAPLDESAKIISDSNREYTETIERYQKNTSAINRRIQELEKSLADNKLEQKGLAESTQRQLEAIQAKQAIAVTRYSEDFQKIFSISITKK